MGDSKCRGKSSKSNISDLNVKLYKHVKYLCASYVSISIRPVPPRNVWIRELNIQPLYTEQLPVIVLVVIRKII